MTSIVKMRYVENVTIPHGALGVPSVYTFRANSIYDPNYTGVGHQPLHHDRYTSLYNHYTVLGAKIKATFATANATQYTGVICGIKLDDNGTLGTTLSNIVEHGSTYTSYKYMDFTVATGKGRTIVKRGFSPKKFFGLKDIKDNRDSVGAPSGSNPAEMAYFTCFYGHLNGTQVLPDVDLNVEIEYLVQFSEPIDQPSS